MGQLVERLQRGHILISDGGWGTMLQEAGLPAGACPEAWNRDHPEAIQAVAAAYAAAGCDLVETNTFGGCRCKLDQHGLGEAVAALNSAGIAHSRAGAPEALILASIGPSGLFLEPYGDNEPEELEALYAEQIAPLISAGADALCIETFSDVDEALCALRAARQIDPTIDVIVSLTFEQSARGLHTMMGVTPAVAAQRLSAAGVDIIASNCGNGIEQMITICRELRAHSSLPIMIQANAGMPELVDGRTVFTQTPADMAAYVPQLIEAGAAIIGGCCGTTPAHIAAIRQAVAAVQPLT